ncbi:histidine phosphatase family protein [Lacisediminimonas sp.]|uniref:histidine phosphatase family protein n=1 Tax=Lacisediminimonas sp. TaxID=3060582 RepID=UPI0027184C38|nr:histidine phosphatase family protein [Lacisediminimonas sp.]MDO8299522.1 histidine phosphatase family protein [Lacisediminimonas sp.]
MRTWLRGVLLSLLVLACGALVLQPALAADEPAWAALAAGNQVVLMRHAATEPGIGDPAGFRKDDCRTQRNLSAAGRESARKIGQVLRDRRVVVSDVWSSRWCRCLDTARLAFGRVQPMAMLDSMFNDPEGSDDEKLRALRVALSARTAGGGNRVLVTHEVNIRRLTGVSVGMGEMVVAGVGAGGGLVVVGRLRVD